MRTTLLIMAAGIGSRFGSGIKQLEPVGLSNEIIMDYSIHDAIAAGFNKVVFVIRKDIESDFRERIGNRIEHICSKCEVEVKYAFQNLYDVPGTVPEGRIKPWGTGHAILSAKDMISEPFLVINADDYYGKEIFIKMHEWLCEEHPENAYAMAGFTLKNTLSENGGVTRGICNVVDGFLMDIVETSNIIKTQNGASANGVEIDLEKYVSMNMWGLQTGFVSLLQGDFYDFFNDEVVSNPLESEFLLPEIIGNLLRNGDCTVTLLETPDRWFGVTYKEDRETVVNSIRKLIENKVYSEELYSDL